MKLHHRIYHPKTDIAARYKIAAAVALLPSPRGKIWPSVAKNHGPRSASNSYQLLASAFARPKNSAGN